MTTHDLGQYFTVDKTLQNKVFEFILNNSTKILEPSCGRGDLIKHVKKKLPNVQFDAYEIDSNMKFLRGVKSTANIKLEDFLQAPITTKYNTIIGNPPYVRTKTGNLYIDFINKCYNLLELNGELIFIIPSDFFKLTSSANVLNNMLKYGTFTHIYHPHDENLFQGASIDILIFRYCKSQNLEHKTLYNNVPLYIINSNGVITFSEQNTQNNTVFQDQFNIYVGLVSGKEDVYKTQELGNIQVLTGENKLEKYIFINKYPTKSKKINTYLQEHKSELLVRKIRDFNENNWYEWGAPRNIKIMQQYVGKECIYLYNLTRQNRVAFLGQIGYFGGNLLMIQPKNDAQWPTEKLTKLIEYLNSNNFKKNFMFSGRFKIGHRQLSNSVLPINKF
jgi:adenine-specific DNA-methyltransferase